MNKNTLTEIIKEAYSDYLIEQRISDVSKYSLGSKLWYRHLKPLTDTRNLLHKWRERFTKLGINPAGVFGVGDVVNGSRTMMWFKCDKQMIDPVQFVSKLTSSDDFYSKGQWRIVENTDSFFVLEYDWD